MVRVLRSYFLTAILIAVPAFHAVAEGAALLTGAVTEAESNRPLADAVVQIGVVSVKTDANGTFNFPALEPGRHTVIVEAPGHHRYEASVELAEGMNKLTPFSLARETVEKIDKLVVSESAEGASAKFTEKVDTEVLAEVVSGRDLQQATAKTGSDLLKNTSGVTVSAGAGGSSNVSVRGIDQRMLRITVDGQRQGGSGNALDNIPPEIVQSLEVTKTFTLDMEADAVGGVINVNTGGTVVTKGYVQGRHQLLYNSLRPKLGTRETLTVARPFSLFETKPNASLMVTASFDDQYKIRERISALREWTPQVSPGPGPYSGQTIPVLTQPLIEDAQDHRERTGIVANGDARLGTTSLYFRSSVGREWTKRNRDYDDTDPASGNLLALTPTSGTFSGVRQSHRNQQQISKLETANFSSGMKTKSGGTDFDATLGWSFAREGEPQTRESVFLSEHTYRVSYDLAPNPYEPKYTVLDETVPGDTASIRDPARYRFDYLSRTKIENVDTEGSAKFNVRINLDDAARSGNYLKFGGKFQQRRRSADTDRDVFTPGLTAFDMVGLTGTALAEMQTVGYRFGPNADTAAVIGRLQRSPGDFLQDTVQTAINSGSGDYSVTETVWAGYGMGRVKLNNWTLLGGLRVESTRVSAEANQMNFDTAGQFQGFTRAHSTSSYTEWLPGLHLRFDPTPGLLYRASVTRSLSRPAYADVVPYRTISFVDRRSRIGTPDLKPYQATNLDLSADRYGETWGLFSVSAFYKKIDHFITDAQYRQQIGNLGQFTEFKRVNGEAAFAMGFEASWQSPTYDLPAHLGKGSVEINYGFNHGEARHPGRPDETLPLPRQVDHQAGLKFHDERGSLSIDFSLRYRSGWWEDLIARGFDNYIEDQWDAEINATYKFGKNIRATVGASNILNMPTRHYAGVRSRMNDSQLNGIDFNAGLQWKI